MKSITIQGTKRESVGKKASRALRDAELVPCVVYGDKVEPLHFSAPEKAFKDLIYTPNAHTATLVIDGEKFEAVVQDVQYHPVNDHIIHIDFYKLHEDKPVVMEVPVWVTGRSKGVVAGGVLSQPFRKLKVKAIPSKLPDEITVDITPLKIGDKLYVESLRNDQYELMHPDNAVVVSVRNSRNAVAMTDDDEEEEAAEESAE